MRWTSKTFPIVGIGASAGGLEAFKEFLQNLPTDTGMGFVLVQHLDPTHESILTELLAKATALPVHEATNKLRVEANHVYVIPPNTLMTVKDGVLQLVPNKKREPRPHRSIDHFLISLANDRGSQAIGVVLSGSATDGTLGLEAIKEQGGIAFAQDDQTAKYNSMPRSAVASGCVDFVLPPGRMAQEIANISRHARAHAPEVEHPAVPGQAERNYRNILALLRTRIGVDFTYYKPSTINRRIARRMVLHKVPRLSAYVTYLRNHLEEVEALYQDLLIGVTGFFRDEAVFEAFKQKHLPRIVKNRNPDQPVRAWVMGCSTGQEAYSLAMIFLEYMSRVSRQIPLQIFATDLNESQLEKARQGLYLKTQLERLSPERLRRFFVEEEGGFRICKPVREMCVFARHDALSDPPFSKMDIVSCRNLMIYLEPVLQKRLIPHLHYALAPSGLLILGASENISGFSDLFPRQTKRISSTAKRRAYNARCRCLLCLERVQRCLLSRKFPWQAWPQPGMKSIGRKRPTG